MPAAASSALVLSLTFGFTAAALAGTPPQSEVYKCPDASGRPTYTNVKRDTVGKNCTLVSKEVQVVPSQAPAASSRNSIVHIGGILWAHQRVILTVGLASQSSDLLKAWKLPRCGGSMYPCEGQIRKWRARSWGYKC